jgi:hypothetical protein
MLPHATQLHYKNTRGWSINYVNAEAEGYRAQGGKNTEWLLVDPLLVDRFATEGQSYLPGAGKKWVHVHRPPHCGPQGFRTGDRVRMRQGVAEYWELDARALVTAVNPADAEGTITIKMDSSAQLYRTQAYRLSRTGVQPDQEATARDVMEAKADDDDELPWQVQHALPRQEMKPNLEDLSLSLATRRCAELSGRRRQVIAIMSKERLDDFRSQQQQHDDTVHAAKEGRFLPHPGHGSSLTEPPESVVQSLEEFAVADPEEADWPAVVQRLTEALDATAQGSWERGLLLVRRSTAFRRSRQLEQAVADAAGAHTAMKNES